MNQFPYAAITIMRKGSGSIGEGFMYKVSNYSFFCLNKKKELLMYNSFVGTESFCKLENGSFSEEILKEKKAEYLPEKLYTVLAEKGILIDETVDERKRLIAKIGQTVNPRELCLYINPTEHCNFRCKYCYESHLRGEMTKEIQDEIIKYVRENIRFFSGLNVEWFGGEPLMGMECIRNLSAEFIKICKFYKRRYSASMTTNGFLLSNELFSQLLDMNVRRFQITIDGIKEDHDSFRVLCNGQGSFDRIMQNLRNIKAIPRRDFSIQLRSNITLKNFINIEEYLELLESLTKDDSRINVAIFKVGDWLDKAKDEIKGDIIETSNDMRRIYEAILNSNKRINLSTLFLNPGSGVCYGGKSNNFLFCSDGSVHKCTVTFEEVGTSVGELINGEIILNDNYYKMISDYTKCDKIFECDSAPVCMGEPCPVADRDDTVGKHCSYFKDCLDIVLQIFDKNGVIERLEG